MLGGWVKAQGGDKQADSLTREDFDKLGATVLGIRSTLH